MTDYVEEDRGFGSPCWIWGRAINGSGYGVAYADKRVQMAHRLYYERYRGPILDGLEIDHLCRVPSCVNPDHLETVTRAENLRRYRPVSEMEPETAALLATLAAERREAFARAERLGLELGQALREAHEAGQTIEQLVRETGYSRRQVYNLIDRKKR